MRNNDSMQSILAEIKHWIDTLTSEELLHAMTFPFSSECKEYDLLIEMLKSQSPPPTPIHPRAMGFKQQASNIPVTDGRWDEEERVLRNRVERPRLFQFIERSENAHDFDIAALGLPSEIASFIREEKNLMNNKVKHKRGNKKQQKNKNKQYEFDVIARKFIAPWGETYSLGCTQNQRDADLAIFAGTRIHHGATTKASPMVRQKCEHYGKFYPDICFNVGKTRIQKQMNKGGILNMLKVVTRGRFLTIPPKSLTQKREDHHRIAFFAPWFDPTKEWFSLPLYLSSRFEVALWYSFLSFKKNNLEIGLPQTIIEEISQCMSTASFYGCLEKSIHQVLRTFLFLELDQLNGKIKDSCAYHLLRKISKYPSILVVYDQIRHCNICELESIPIFDFGNLNDVFRIKLVRTLEEVLSETVGKALLESQPKSISNIKQTSKSTKRAQRKRLFLKNRPSHEKAIPLHELRSIDEGGGGNVLNSSDEEVRDKSHCNVSNDVMNKSMMFILEIVDSIFINTFNDLGFHSECDKDNGFIPYREHKEQKRAKKEYILKPIDRQNNTGDHSSLQPKTTFLTEVGIESNQMTMRRSNLSAALNKAASPPMLGNEQCVHDFFQPYFAKTVDVPNHPSMASMNLLNLRSISNQQAMQYDNNDISLFSLKPHVDEENDYGESNFCLDSAFDRIEKNLMNDLFDTEQRYIDDQIASSTAASISSSVIELNDEESQDNISNQVINKEKKANDATCSPILAIVDENGSSEASTDKDIYENTSSIMQTPDTEQILKTHGNEQFEKELSQTNDYNGEHHSEIGSESATSHTADSPKLESPVTPPPQLSPILVSLADLGEFRKNVQKESINTTKNDVGVVAATPVLLSSVPGPPKVPTRSWSREDLRIPTSREDCQNPSLQSYRDAAKKGSQKPLSTCSHDIEGKRSNGKHVESIRFARSVSSLQSFAREVIIDGSIHFNVCAQSESALEDHEDSSHWNVIPIVEADNASDGATTISSIPSMPMVDHISSLKGERDAYRDMCLTLGSEIAMLKNFSAVEKLSNGTLVYMSHRTSSIDQTPETFDAFLDNHKMFDREPILYRSLDNRYSAKSDAGIHNDTQMSEDGTDIFHGSITATDTSRQQRTINSNSINNKMKASTNGGRVGSDLASFDHETGYSVFNPPTSTCFLRRDSFGPAHLHCLRSRLGSDMNSFLLAIARQLENNSKRRELARKRLTMLVTTLWPRAQVKIYGSHVTGLCLPSSDLDVVICLPAVHKNIPADTPGALEGRNAINESNQKLLARKLKSESWIEPRSIKIIERTVVPVIKVMTKDTRSKSLQLDISFDTPEHHGLDAIELVTDTLSHYPMLRSVVLVLKQFLLDKGLLTAYTGGISSYCLFLMVTRYLQETSDSGWSDPGVILMGFLDFYGNHFDPRSTGISVKRNEYFNRSKDEDLHYRDRHERIQIAYPTKSRSYAKSRPFSFDPLFVEDPISEHNNVGRNSFRINQVQRLCSDAHRALVASLEWDMNCASNSEGGFSLLKCLLQRDYSIERRLLDSLILDDDYPDN
jgi:DNA polymerase sigma